MKEKTSRLDRGRVLADAGAAVQHGDLWVVHGNGQNYTVNLDNGRYGATCACADWRNRLIDDQNGRQCKHIIAALITQARDSVCAGVA